MTTKKTLIAALIIFSFKSSSAQLTFQKTIGGTSGDRAFSLMQTNDGGYIIGGNTYSFAAGLDDIYLIKTNDSGDTLWTKTFGGLNFDECYSLQQTYDGGYVIAGTTKSFGAGNEDIYLIRTDSSGYLIWSKTFGGLSNEECHSVTQTKDSGFVIAGFSDSFGGGNVYIIKTDSGGDTLWTKTYGGTSPDEGYCAKQTNDGGYIIAGTTYSFGAGNYDIYLIKTDSSGNPLWSKTFGGTGIDDGQSVAQATDGGFIICGITDSFGAGGNDAYLIKTDNSGNLLWSKTFGGTAEDVSYAVKQTSDQGYILVCYTGSFGAGWDDAYLIKTDSSGNLLWSKTFGGANNEYSYSVQQTNDGGYIVAGETLGFGTGGSDVYLIKTDSLGNVGCNQGNPVTVTTSPPTQVTTPTTFVNSPATIVTTPTFNIGSGGIANTLCISVSISELTTNNSFFVFPNPSSGSFQIDFGNSINNGTLELYNTLGEIFFEEVIFNESRKEIKLKTISRGIYFVKVFDGAKYHCKKIIIEQD